MDPKVIKAAAGNLRKELRAHGGKKLMPPEAAPKPAVTVELDEDEELPAKKKAGI